MTSTGEQAFAELTALLVPDGIVRRNEPMARRTTLRVGGPVDLYVEPASETQLSGVLQLSRRYRLPVVILGRGSNLLVRDGGIRGMVVCLSHPGFARIEVKRPTLRAGAGARLKNVAAEARQACLAGFEFMEGIPGSVGGALRMNAGAMGAWTFDLVESMRLMDGEGIVEERGRESIEVEYRACPLVKSRIALAAVFRGQPGSREAIEEKATQFNRKRWDSQPAAASAGCVFKNPPGIPAGRLVDELGLKGTRIGDAVVSDVHANFIVNQGRASASDVLRLIQLIQEKARSERGIELEPEVEIIGD